MFLSDVDIKKGVEDGTIVIKPFDNTRLQQASYDILLGNTFWVTSAGESLLIDPANKIYSKFSLII